MTELSTSKKEFIVEVNSALAENTEILMSKKDTERIIDCVFAEIKEALYQKHSISWPGFGKFEPATTKPKKGRNPATGESLDIPAKNKVRFKPAVALKELLN